ncbi:hypothetical protein ACFLZ8_06245 [Planctomycetota bacterium]
MGAFKIGRSYFLSYTFFLLAVQADFFPTVHVERHISECARSVSLGPAALREWATNKLVGASPPQAERDRPARC